MKTTLMQTLRRLSLITIGVAATTGSVDAQLYSNYMAASNSVDRLSIYKGNKNRFTRATWSVGGKGGTKLRIKHQRSNGWESILGRPKLSSRVRHAELKYQFYCPSHAWQYRWLGKFPGLQPAKPHFGGNRNDAPVWDRWSARLMWFAIKSKVERNDDSSPRPSAYLYTQDRKKGSTGAHNRSSLEFRKNRWYNVRLNVKLNSHRSDRNPRRDGRVNLYINGTLEKSVPDQIFVGRIPASRSIRDAEIHQVAFHSYYGGNKRDRLNVPTVSETLNFIDDVIVDRK